MSGPTGVRVALVLDVDAHAPEGAYAVLDVAWQHLAGHELRVEVETQPPARGTWAGLARTPDGAPAVTLAGPDGARQDVPLDGASHVTLWRRVPQPADRQTPARAHAGDGRTRLPRGRRGHP